MFFEKKFVFSVYFLFNICYNISEKDEKERKM